MNSRKPARDHALHRQHARAQVGRQVVAEQRHRRAAQRQHEHPQQHRAFVVAPDAGDLVEQRLVGVAVLDDVDDREIRGDVGVHQRRHRQRDQRELRQRRVAAHRHPRRHRRAPRPASGTAACTSATQSARISAKWPSSVIMRRSLPLSRWTKLPRLPLREGAMRTEGCYRSHRACQATPAPRPSPATRSRAAGERDVHRQSTPQRAARLRPGAGSRAAPPPAQSIIASVCSGSG